MEDKSIVKEKQRPLRETYLKHPEAAWITDIAVIEGTQLDDPFHTTVSINEEMKRPFQVGVHKAVGGLHDFPNPGDLLCASLASCFETTMRLIANRLQIRLLKTRVKATANVDVRGTLLIDKDVPVNFQSMGLEVDLKISDLVSSEMVEKLVKGTERSCIVFQTIKQGIPVDIRTQIIN